ncbi:MAG TPA: hypothetical protein VI407_10970, partial [Erythrobacter sp.]
MSGPARKLWLLGVAFGLPALAFAFDPPLVPDLPPVAQLTPGNVLPLTARVLESSAGDPPAPLVTSGALEGRFLPFVSHGSHFITTPLWFRLQAPGAPRAGADPVLLARSGIDQPVEVFASRDGQTVQLAPATVVPQFGGAQDTVFAL